MCATVGGEHDLRRERKFVRAVLVEERERVVSLPKVSCARLRRAGDSSSALRLRVRLKSRFGGKATQNGPSEAQRLAEDVGLGVSSSLRLRCRACLVRLDRSDGSRPPRRPR